MTERVCTCPDKEKYCKEPCACCQEELLQELDKQRMQARGFQIMGRNMVELGREYWMTQLDLGRYERAAGDAICGMCGMKYIEHPEIKGWPTFVVACSGRIWKL